MVEGLIKFGSKILDIVFKRSKNAEKEQDIEVKKIDVYSKLIATIMIVALFMCVLASLFPSLAITGWWFDLLERLLQRI